MAVLSLSGDDADEEGGFGKHNKARLALLPNTVAADRVASDSPLLGLPLEILTGIVDLMADDHVNLAALALVNSDCRQLARSHQFANVYFDGDEKSNGLLVRLLQETNHATRPPFVGPCIRRVAVRPGSDLVLVKHNSHLGDTAATSYDEQLSNPQTDVVSKYIAAFRNPVLAVLKAAMPNLESFSWYGGICLDATSFFATITDLPIRHLKIGRLEIGEPTSFEHCQRTAALPVESLYLDVGLCHDAVHGGRTPDAPGGETRSLSPFITALLRSCSTTLKHFDLNTRHFFWTDTKSLLSFGRERILFPRLQYLSLHHIDTSFDDTAWSSFFSAPLRHLVLPWFTLPTPDFRQALSACQELRHLEGLEVPYLGREGWEEPQAIIDFISRHPHLQRLAVSYGAAESMDSYLLPCLSNGRWSNLTSLLLTWGGPKTSDETRPNIVTITAASLAAIGKIESLEQLNISAGIQVGWRNQWLIDHDVLRSSLGGLRKLKRLALSRDTYSLPGGLPLSDVEGYYITPVLPLGDLNDVPEWTTEESIRDIWERGHRGRMIKEANKYAALLPGLEWVYCGQWPMDIRDEQTSSRVLRSAVPMGEKRNPGGELLRHMFSVTKK